MTATLERPTAPTVQTRDVVLLFCLAGLSGAALIARTYWKIPMLWTVGFLTLPAGIGIVIVVFAGQGRYRSLRIVSDRVIAGAQWGVIATIAYDVVRPLLVWGLRLHYNPYRAQPIFGSLITNRPRTDAVAITVGWIYHAWNGVSFAVMLALVKPRASVLMGLLWALGLQGCMMAVYPKLLEVRLDSPGFLITTIVGHGMYGIVLGATLSKWGPE